jgi:undecaprenyl diphosphate synthase
VNAPRHLAIIPDGNRRWARTRGLPAFDGHRKGIQVIGEITTAAWAAGVEVVTFWWGSPANLTQRSPEEVAVITGALDRWLAGDGADRIARAGAQFLALGRWQTLCPQIEPGVAAARAAAGPGPRTLVLLLACDAREEILAAADALAGSGGGPDAFRAELWTGALPPVDLVLRTGGQPHLSSGFLLWQIAEAQLSFSARLWPDFDAAALDETLAVYASTERRYGR